ncbi:HD domain-containing protein [Desulfurococcus mucosus]|uniref:Metal dependent phosphohydrolase n=1 Tax=Desulfurococcus mucosus (strain ATCC 35584 / DSM 2162 / JCM 9187 / O7/1) TaxID=765177 RepID=E8RA67_DESM0|nr:HD domain-containing protein [Desulfurococcus mucosus]ADV65373.1 metal dependent phosphohydrolase [Desulfurococcus mucosus DSM 2162]
MEPVGLVEKICRALYDTSLEHGWPHVERVLGYSLKIAREGGVVVDEELLKLAVFLHDLGRMIGEPHAYYSALAAEELLVELGLPRDRVEAVVDAIKAHSFSFNRSGASGSTLSMILSDADKLDALGLIGFIRVFLYGERHGRSLEESLKHFDEKILRLEGLMRLEYSRRLARCLSERTRFLLSMLGEELRQECNAGSTSASLSID